MTYLLSDVFLGRIFFVNLCKEKSAVKNKMIFDRTLMLKSLINSSI
jgi:hypothetical protein